MLDLLLFRLLELLLSLSGSSTMVMSGIKRPETKSCTYDSDLRYGTLKFRLLLGFSLKLKKLERLSVDFLRIGFGLTGYLTFIEFLSLRALFGFSLRVSASYY